LGSKVRVDTTGLSQPTASSAFYVTGIIATGADSLDRVLALVDLGDLQEVIGAGDSVHEVTIVAAQGFQVAQVAAQVAEALSFVEVSLESDREDIAMNGEAADGPAPPSVAGLEVAPWWDILPDLKGLFDMMDSVFGFIYLLMLLLMSGGVLSTTYTMVYERRREFGIQLALGTSPWRLFGSVMTESVWLALLSILVGTALGGLFVFLLCRYGIDLRRFSGAFNMGAVQIDSVLVGRVSTKVFTEPAMVIFLGTIVFTFIPALRLARMKPIDAMVDKG